MSVSMYELAQFSGTMNYYRHWTNKLIYTDGIHYLEENGAAWLIDAIASHQINPKLKTGDLRDFQLWELQVKDNKAVLTCKADSNCEPEIVQDIEFTDFPLEAIKIYVELGSVDGRNECLVAMLPSER